MRKNNKNKGPRRRRYDGDQGTVERSIARANRPPQLSSYSIMRKNKLRFSCSTAQASFKVTLQNILDCMLVATTATAGVQLWQAIRLRSVEAWAPSSGANTTNPAGATPNTVSVVFTGTAGGNFDTSNTIFTDTSMSVEPAHIYAPVPNYGESTMWNYAGTGSTAFTLSCPVGTVIDVVFDGCNAYAGSIAVPVATTGALVGATAGNIYLRGLDGTPIAATQLPPVAPAVMVQ